MFDHFGFWLRSTRRLSSPKIPEIGVCHLPTDGACLDGGGTGRIAQTLRGQAGTIVVADLSLKMLDQAHNKDGLRLACSHSERLPFPEASFERVIIVDALHHVIDQQQTADELWRVLKPGGWLVIEEPDIRVWGVKLIAVFEKLVLMRSHFLSPEQIAALFSHHQAKVSIDTKGYNSWVSVENRLALAQSSPGNHDARAERQTLKKKDRD
jgi:demethylmenaquinone methyltransferase/2-methoxy-6-polyprenyl-1,4-benzoquinol methylase